MAGPSLEHHQFPCGQCGAMLTWDPGATALKCSYCGYINEAPADPAAAAEVGELDYKEGLTLSRQPAATETIQVVKCSACAAEFTLDGAERSRPCPFCGTNVVVDTHPADRIRPGGVLPFKIAVAEARDRYRTWLNGLWFAPGGLKKQAAMEGGLTGMYVPYWTFDAHTDTRYSGERGDDYFVAEAYTATENGKSVTRSRQVKRTRWSPASGTVQRDFDDVMVLASRSLPPSQTKRLEPWDLHELAPYDARYLSGFSSEAYQVELDAGFTDAKAQMEQQIRGDVQRDIGGDQQRVHSLHTRHADVTYKHVLLPVWLAAYRFGGKPYRFLVNGRTGEVQGERPWSWLKIGGLVAAVILAIALAAWAFSGGSGPAG